MSQCQGVDLERCEEAQSFYRRVWAFCISGCVPLCILRMDDAITMDLTCAVNEGFVNQQTWRRVPRSKKS